YMEDIGSLFLDRENVRESLKTITEGTNRLSQGLSLGLFPEGTRNHTDQLLPFKP
ncbi:MAG: 1-acyl-sn-glycerol-3-phosphate acyltransferase, partial [Eubacterium sp.]|nr:1-acyl-sn-glycerol-3-phosphate acyltransferase [Eubacterium sp.]